MTPDKASYIDKRFKELLEEGGYRWDAFSSTEVQIARIQASEEWDEQHNQSTITHDGRFEIAIRCAERLKALLFDLEMRADMAVQAGVEDDAVVACGASVYKRAKDAVQEWDKVVAGLTNAG